MVTGTGGRPLLQNLLLLPLLQQTQLYHYFSLFLAVLFVTRPSLARPYRRAPHQEHHRAEGLGSLTQNAGASAETRGPPGKALH